MENEKQKQLEIVDQKDVPLALKFLIETSNRTLQETQAKLLEDITQSASELMDIMGLKREDGWVLDLQMLKFVRLSETDPTDK